MSGTLIPKGGYYSSGPTLVDMGLIADGGGHSWTTGVTATIGGQLGALRLRAQWNLIDGTQGAGSGVMLPRLTGGQLIYIFNRSTSSITIWVAVNTTDTVVGAGTSEVLPAGISRVYLSVADGWVKWLETGGTSSGPFMPLSGGTVSPGTFAANGTTQDPNASTSTALFTGTGTYGNQAWFPSTSLWVPNGGLWALNPHPYGAAGLATTAWFSLGRDPHNTWPGTQGGLVSVGDTDLAIYPNRDRVTLQTEAVDLGPMLVLSGVTYDATHLYPHPSLTPTQVASILPNMVIDTNHTPKMTGLVTGVASDGSSITVKAWYQVVGSYVSAAAIVAANAGAGYAVNDICTVMSRPSGACAQVRVTAVGGGGAITGLAVTYAGSYFQGAQNNPALAQTYPLYGGSGSGALVTLTYTDVAANTATGQNPQTVPLLGASPPAFKAWVNPTTKTWNRGSLAPVGANWSVYPWTLPWIEGGGVTAATGEEMDVGNWSGSYLPGNDGIYGDFPQIRGFEIPNNGNARASAGLMVIGDWQNGFVSYGAIAGVTAFGSYTDPYGWRVRIMTDGNIHLGGQKAVAASTAIQWHTQGSAVTDAQIMATGGTPGTAYAASLSVAAANVAIAPAGGANNIVLAGAALGSTPTLSVLGGDGNVSLNIQTAGALGTINTLSPLHANAPLSVMANAAGTQPAQVNGGSVTWNYVAGSGEVDYWNGFTGAPLSHTFWQQTGGAPSRLMDITPSGGVIAYFYLQIAGNTGPTWTSGSAVPSGVQPVGSLYSRVGGAVGATLYVSRGGGTWAAVAGV